MDQIITLLSNLFNLTKVASVTLPGLALAAALALFLWPPHPIDTVRIPVITMSPEPPSEAQTPCSELPVLERGNLPAGCDPKNSVLTSPPPTTRPSCTLTAVYLNLLDDADNFDNSTDWPPSEILELCQEAEEFEPEQADPGHRLIFNQILRNHVQGWCAKYKFNSATGAFDPGLAKHVRDSERIPHTDDVLAGTCQEALRELNSLHEREESDNTLRDWLKQLCAAGRWLKKWPLGDGEGRALAELTQNIRQTESDWIGVAEVLAARDVLTMIATSHGKLPWQKTVLRQFVLEKTKDRLTQCLELETALLGQEQADNEELKTDISSLDKQRSDLQDAYIASLKTNDRVISDNFRRKLSGILELSNEYRARSGVNLQSVNERTRRLDEIKQEQGNVAALLAQPGSLRATQGFDAYIQGLVNHVVGFILLSLALSLILIAFDRTVLGSLFEDVFPGW